MEHYVYILFSDNHNVFYKGYTTNPEKRLEEHNQNKSRYTKGKGPWKLVFTKRFDTKSEALKEELRLKKLNRASIEKLIAQNS
ncbi:MAG: GIY-YIG nuclease family protein [Bacteroidia bacterium]|nr:GIY-YIG nuclease family protein [Bacteroidia bacterium]